METSTLLALVLATAIAGAAAFPLSKALRLRFLMAGPAVRRGAGSDPTRVVMDLVSYAEAAHRGGASGLASLLSGVRDPVVAKALSLAVGGADEATVRRALGPDPLTHTPGGARWVRREGVCLAALGAALAGSLVLVVLVASGHTVATSAAALVLCGLYGSMMFTTVASGGSSSEAATQLLMHEIVVAGAMAIRDGVEPGVLRSKLLSLLPDEGSRAEQLAQAA